MSAYLKKDELFSHCSDDPELKQKSSSLTADSPYYTAHVDSQLRDLNIFAETLREISSKAKHVGKCGILMSEATKRLSSACKMQPSKTMEDEDSQTDKIKSITSERKKSLGTESVEVFGLLAIFLDDIAEAQMKMFETIEASLSASLESFLTTEVQLTNKLKAEADEATNVAETYFASYLHGKGNVANNSSDDASPVSSWNKISEGVGNQLGRIGISSKIQTDSNTQAKRSSGPRIMSDKGELFDKAIFQANLRLNLEEIRLFQTESELKRSKLLEHLDSFKVSM